MDINIYYLSMIHLKTLKTVKQILQQALLINKAPMQSGVAVISNGERRKDNNTGEPLRNFNVWAFTPKGLMSAIPQCIATEKSIFRDVFKQRLSCF